MMSVAETMLHEWNSYVQTCSAVIMYFQLLVYHIQIHYYSGLRV